MAAALPTSQQDLGATEKGTPVAALAKRVPGRCRQGGWSVTWVTLNSFLLQLFLLVL